MNIAVSIQTTQATGLLKELALKGWIGEEARIGVKGEGQMAFIIFIYKALKT